MVIFGAVGLGVYRARPAPTRSFPVFFQDGEIVYPQFAYPLRHEIVPIWLAALLASIIPIFIILCMQIRIRKFHQSIAFPTNKILTKENKQAPSGMLTMQSLACSTASSPPPYFKSS